jgi:hypothetical protein
VAESTGNSLGSFSGTLDGFSTATNNADSSQIIINISSPPITDNTFGNPAHQTLEFKDMNPFQTVTMSGLAFTSNTYLTAAQVALAFSDLSAGATADEDGLITGSAGNALGTFKGALVGLSTGSSKTDSPVLVTTSTANSISVSGTQPIGVDATPVLTSGDSNSKLTFKALVPNQTVSVGGLEFTARTYLTATQVASAFANLSDGDTGNAAGTLLGNYNGEYPS